jgi:hypothetical protein
VKTDTKRFPRVIRPDGEPIDVLSPLSHNTLEADGAAFVALMRHLKQIDNEQHTVLMIQVENESGNIGSIRDNSPEANRAFAGAVPSDLLKATQKRPGTWSQVFTGDADEMFQIDRFFRGERIHPDAHYEFFRREDRKHERQAGSSSFHHQF